MPFGPGKYDDDATAIREKLKANGIILIVLGGEKGQGFSAQLDLAAAMAMPEMLRTVADQIEETQAEIKAAIDEIGGLNG
jgi:hypothetical protein